MDEDPDDPSFEPGDNPGQKKKTGFKLSSMVDMKPREDLHRYLVDKFHSSTKSKTVSFEKIDLSTYKPTAKVAMIFLCDSNGKFLDTRQMFSSKHEVKYIRAPLIEHARSYLQNDVRTPPQLIILHTGTNDLERTNSPEELISNILILITEASTKFPSSKIFFSTLLPRNDIRTQIIT